LSDFISSVLLSSSEDLLSSLSSFDNGVVNDAAGVANSVAAVDDSTDQTTCQNF